MNKNQTIYRMVYGYFSLYITVYIKYFTNFNITVKSRAPYLSYIPQFVWFPVHLLRFEDQGKIKVYIFGLFIFRDCLCNIRVFG